MNIMHKLKLGPHYAIERFGIAVGLIFVAFVVFAGGAIAHTVQDAAARNASQTVYTASFSTSSSGVSGEVYGVYANESRTRAAVLMKLSDMSHLSIDAADYHMTLSGMDDFGYTTRLHVNPACGMYVYGDSGYMVFYMTSDQSMPRQRMGLFVDMGLTMGGTTADEAKATDSFSISFNPGADDVHVSKALEGDTFDPIAFYQSAVTAQEEQKLRKQLVDDVATMRNELSYIAEYQNRVKNDGLILDGMIPEWVAGDGIEFEGDSMHYTPKTILPGGIAFDWASCSIADEVSYIDAALKAADLDNPDELLNQLGRVKTPAVNTLAWTLKDGTPLDVALEMDSENDRYVKANDDATTLTAAWLAYGSTKADYQGDHLRALIELEYAGDKIAQTYTSTTTNDGTISLNV